MTDPVLSHALSRRQSLKLGVATTAGTLLLGGELAQPAQAAIATVTPPFTTPFAVNLPS